MHVRKNASTDWTTSDTNTSYLAPQERKVPTTAFMMESHLQQSSGHTSNTPPRIRCPHATMTCTPSSPSCVETASSRAKIPFDRSNFFSIQDSARRSINLCEDSHLAFQKQGEDRPVKGDLGKILPPCGDYAMALNPSRWHVVVDKDVSPRRSHASPLKRSTKLAKSHTERKVPTHNRWASEVDEHDETETAMCLTAAQKEKHSQSQRLKRPTRKASGFRADFGAEVSSASVAPKHVNTISVSSVVATQTRHPRLRMSSLASGSEKPVRRRSFDEIPTLPQRQHSVTSLGTLDDISSSSPTSI
jgi:hypothetical protein